MSLSCLTCQGLQRTDSDKCLDEHIQPFERLTTGAAARKRSGCLGCSPRERLRKGSSSFTATSSSIPPQSKAARLRKYATTATANMEEHAAAAVGTEQPRLVRSSGMRRDWSFEDLQKKVLVVNMPRSVQ
ncbi:hypothetical protein H6P81_007397 [Aristolochia fimbriata]|uniref:Uncharacterized protein n=1 Tax=Aristolochia fimbriata TaxID=158543 RepID=A0AAV7F0A0_ARIFI|nr:hypothetical protein H6P81_007397 [Aristolochia fimbriata]